MFQYQGHEQLLGVRFAPADATETVSDAQGRTLLTAKYKNGAIPVEWSVAEGTNCTKSYDR